MKPVGKVVVVTGAGNGMGRELTLELLQRGARVAAVDIRAQALEQTSALAGVHAQALATYTTDITDLAAVKALVQRTQEHFGSVDAIINNAGIIQPFVTLADLELSTIDRVFDVNFRGTLFMVKSFLPVLLARAEAHIVNISSMGGFLPVPGQTIYGASKAAVKLMTEGLHAELRDTPVRVTLVLPGALGTNIMDNSGVSLRITDADKKRNITTSPRAAARQILDGMEHDAYRVLVGRDAKLLDAMYRLAPARAAALVAKQMKKLLL